MLIKQIYIVCRITNIHKTQNQSYLFPLHPHPQTPSLRIPKSTLAHAACHSLYATLVASSKEQAYVILSRPNMLTCHATNTSEYVSVIL